MKVKALYNFSDLNIGLSTYPNGVIKGQVIEVGEEVFNYLINKGYIESLEEPKIEDFICEDCKLPEVNEEPLVEEPLVEEKPKKKPRKKKVEDEYTNNN